VDDVYDNRDILTRRLTRRGFAVDEASGGCEALEKLKAQDFDLVLLDIMMPDMCGNEVLRAIRRTHSALQLPVIMVTAKSHSEDVVESLDLGANDYITKPVDFAVALARINSQLARKFAAEEEARARRAVEQNAEALRRTNADLEAEALQRRLSEERLQRLAYLDGLTGLLNRTAFRERAVEVVDDAMAEGRDPAILFIDLDRFKAINDVYGHEAGDNLLGEVAARLRALVGDRGYVARLGGDEFGILLKDTTRGPMPARSPRPSSAPSASPSRSATGCSRSARAAGSRRRRTSDGGSRSCSRRPISRCTARSPAGAAASPASIPP
jgi:PleD family two-component response regulator